MNEVQKPRDSENFILDEQDKSSQKTDKFKIGLKIKRTLTLIVPNDKKNENK